ncbi:MAG: alanine dehydrogenase [Mariprofundaceae bacterium]|nr:alanine dehydrogenase [Mariprofundaceae bacterium]
MRLGIPKEIKNGENRVALTPKGVALLVEQGHAVLVEASAGIASGFSDALYQHVGAEIVCQPDAWSAEWVIKVKEPLPEEYDFFRPNLGIFTFLHLAAMPELAAVLLKERVRAIAYETIALQDGNLPLLAPMSQIAGRVSMLMAAEYLRGNSIPSCNKTDQKGLLLGGISGVDAGHVTILGAGNVGIQAADVAIALGASVSLFDCRKEHLDACKKRWSGKKISTSLLDEKVLLDDLPHSDVLIGAALIAGEHAPQLLTANHIALMEKGSVFMDVAIDQGGISETSKVTSYDNPVYLRNGVWHCCLPNFPASVPRTSSMALENASLEYISALACNGFDKTMKENMILRRGLNVLDGKIMHTAVASALGLPLGSSF